MGEGTSEIILYQTDDGRNRIEVKLADETVWLSQALMADLFQKDVRTISGHITNIYDEGELEIEATIRDYRIVQNEGQRQVARTVAFYNLDVIISVGYRVKSHRGTQFRQWATQKLREFLVKGFALDDERLKGGTSQHDYFDELLERVRDIRTSERRFYQKITDIYATSVDYDPHAQVTQDFFATIQNKFHFAITGQTAAELIVKRADAEKPNMGLTSWKGAKVRKTDTVIAKNYLTEDELRSLNLIVDQYLSFAEAQAQRRIPMHMAEWIGKLHGFLTLNDRNILKDAGHISADEAKRIAGLEFGRYEAKRKAIESTEPTSDFDRSIKELEVKRSGPPKKQGE